MNKISVIFIKIGKGRVLLGCFAIIMMLTILIEKQNPDWNSIQFTLLFGLPVIVFCYISLAIDLFISVFSNKLDKQTKKIRMLYFLSLSLLFLVAAFFVLI